MTKEEFEGFEVVCIGTDPYAGNYYRVSNEDFYIVFASDGDLLEIMPSPLGGIPHGMLKDYGKFLKKATKALRNFLPVPFEQ